MRVLFCNIGWMAFYNGLSETDQITGGGSWVEESGTGGEIYNFTNETGKYYGFVMFQGQIRIEKLGASWDDDHVSNVLVVWLAKNPKVGGLKIIGWYKNATVYRFAQDPIHGTSRDNEGFWYNVTANAADSLLLPLDERTFSIPRATKYTGGIGQSNVWYCDGEKNSRLRSEVLKYISGYQSSTRLSRKGFFNRKKKTDISERLQVEINAVNAVIDYYKALGYEVNSVEKDNVGWDLVARLNKISLKIEVKGLSKEIVNVSLTPNEYKALCLNKHDYRLCVVTNALDEDCLKLYVFYYNADLDSWMDYENNVLEIDELVSAQFTLPEDSQ